MPFPYRRLMLPVAQHRFRHCQHRQHRQHPPPQFRVIVTLVRRTGRRAWPPTSEAIPVFFHRFDRLRRNEREIRLPAVRIDRRQFFAAIGAADVEKAFATGTGKWSLSRIPTSVSRRLSPGPMISTGTFFSLTRAQIRRRSRPCNCRAPSRRRPFRAWSVRGTAARPAAGADCWRCCRRPMRRPARGPRRLLRSISSGRPLASRAAMRVSGESGGRLQL